MERQAESQNKVCSLENKWYVMRTLARNVNERVITEMDSLGIRYYQPKCFSFDIVRGKRVRRLKPLIPNLFFVYGMKEEIKPLTMPGKKFQFIFNKFTGIQADCMIVPERQMEDFIRVTTQYDKVTYLNDVHTELEKGQKVRIISGDFCGVEGVYIRPAGKRSKTLVVEAGGIAVSVYVERDSIELID